jgi:hypothetical protein
MKAPEYEPLNRIADAILELKAAGYMLANFKIEENKERGLTGSMCYRCITIQISRYTDLKDNSLELPGLYEKLSTSAQGNSLC